MAHDFEKFPELTNNQMQFYYWESPHKQIFENFTAEVVRVKDGDTLLIRAPFREFDFSLRLSNIAAPELNERGGKESQEWLESLIEGKWVNIEVNYYNRVEKWGRLLGEVKLGGFDVGEMSVITGHAIEWNRRAEGQIIDPIR